MTRRDRDALMCIKSPLEIAEVALERIRPMCRPEEWTR